MTDQQRIEVYRAHRDAQTRYTYFLLAAVGAGIALAVNQTRDVAMSWSQIPLAGAVLCWGFSFFFGCRHLGYGMSVLRANLDLLLVEAGQHPLTGTHPEAIKLGSATIREMVEKNNNIANKYGYRQFSLLVWGAVLYVAWHVLEMYLRVSQVAAA